MKVQKKVSIQGEWAKAKVDLDNGDIIKVIDGGKIVPGDYGERHVFKVETKNGEKLLSFNQTTMNYLIDAFGEETDSWAGKEVKVWLIKSNVSGKIRNVVYLTAPDWVEGEDGFYPPNVKPDDGIPVINAEETANTPPEEPRKVAPTREGGEINVKDLPF